MSAIEKSGEIVAVGQIIEPERALLLGNTVRSLFRQYVELPRVSYRENGAFKYDESNMEVSALRTGKPTDSFWIGRSDLFVIDQTLAKFEELLKERGVYAPLVTDAEFFVGTAGGANWHYDPSEEYRLLVSLSEQDLQLKVASEWGIEDCETNWDEKGRMNPEGPLEYQTLTYMTGQGILLDNMCDPGARTPHAGVIVPEKVFLRAYAVHPVE